MRNWCLCVLHSFCIWGAFSFSFFWHIPAFPPYLSGFGVLAKVRLDMIFFKCVFSWGMWRSRTSSTFTFYHGKFGAILTLTPLYSFFFLSLFSLWHSHVMLVIFFDVSYNSSGSILFFLSVHHIRQFLLKYIEGFPTHLFSNVQISKDVFSSFLMISCL